MILLLGDTYYLTGPQQPYWEGEVNAGVRLWSSKDLVHFTDHGLILKRSDMPKHLWCRDRFWAPELFDGNDGWIYLPRIFIRRVDYFPDETVKLYEDIGFGE